MKKWWFAGSADHDGDSIRIHSNESGVLDDILKPYYLIPCARFDKLRELVKIKPESHTQSYMFWREDVLKAIEALEEA